MKWSACIYSFIFLLLLAGCNKEKEEIVPEPEIPSVDEVPEGYFMATFSGFGLETRAAVVGQDARVQHIRYLVYKSSGEFVKERIILTLGTTAVWPLGSVRDTLPKGSYKAVFLANVEKTLFPFSTSGSTVTYSEVLQNYKGTYSDARINLPGAEFKSNTEYYWARKDFSDSNPTPSIILQRIIGMENVHRNVVDAQVALDKLVNNIVTQIGYKDILKTTAQGLLTTEVKAVVGERVPALTLQLLGGLDAVVNPLISNLIQPVTDTLYNRLLKQLVHRLGTSLAGNEEQNPDVLELLGEVLNPWESMQAQTAIVTINNFPKSVDYELTVKEYYSGLHTYRYDFVTDNFFSQKCLYIKNFSGLFDIRKINVIKQGLVGGVVFDGIVDNPLLLNGTFIDINDPLVTTPLTNKRYKANYSFVDLGLKSYTQQTDGNHSLTVQVQLLEIGNIDGLLGGIPILGTILNLVLSPLKNITISVPLNLPLLGVDNLKLSGGWDIPTAY